MATTTAQLTLSSTDLTSDALSLTTTATLTDTGSTTGVTQTEGLSRKTTSSNSQYTLFNAAPHTVYIKNCSATASEYVSIAISGEEIGRLYAGDWMFIPWGAHDTDNDLKVTPSVTTSLTVEYMLIIAV